MFYCVYHADGLYLFWADIVVYYLSNIHTWYVADQYASNV